MLYATDYDNNRIRRITTTGGVVTTIAGSGAGKWVDGVGTAASFNEPWGIAVDAVSGALYIGDNNNNAIRVMHFPTRALITAAAPLPPSTQVIDRKEALTGMAPDAAIPVRASFQTAAPAAPAPVVTAVSDVGDVVADGRRVAYDYVLGTVVDGTVFAAAIENKDNIADAVIDITAATGTATPTTAATKPADAVTGTTAGVAAPGATTAAPASTVVGDSEHVTVDDQRTGTAAAAVTTAAVAAAGATPGADIATSASTMAVDIAPTAAALGDVVVATPLHVFSQTAGMMVATAGVLAIVVAVGPCVFLRRRAEAAGGAMAAAAQLAQVAGTLEARAAPPAEVATTLSNIVTPALEAHTVDDAHLTPDVAEHAAASSPALTPQVAEHAAASSPALTPQVAEHAAASSPANTAEDAFVASNTAEVRT